MSAFKFNSAAVAPQAEVRVDVPDSSDAARITSARLRAIERSKESNADSNYGFRYPAEHYKDFAGPETSAWDAAVLVCIAAILETPILKRSRFVWEPENSYNAQTGMFNLSDSAPVAIQELKSAIDARISELGLSKPLMWEWYADVREPIGREWWRQDLEPRVQKFRKVEN